WLQRCEPHCERPRPCPKQPWPSATLSARHGHPRAGEPTQPSPHDRSAFEQVRPSPGSSQALFSAEYSAAKASPLRSSSSPAVAATAALVEAAVSGSLTCRQALLEIEKVGRVGWSNRRAAELR